MLVKHALASFQLLELPPSISAANEKSNNTYTSGELAISPKKSMKKFEEAAPSKVVPSTSKAIDVVLSPPS
jgi:hypothetical protein